MGCICWVVHQGRLRPPVSWVSRGSAGAAFRDAHESAKGLSGEDKDPKEYVQDNG